MSRLPARAYVAGDPRLAADLRGLYLDRLIYARHEASQVAATLQAAGVSNSAVVLRRGRKASEDSYRREAGGSELVHLACHAKLKEPAHRSCLYLAPTGDLDGTLLAAGDHGRPSCRRARVPCRMRLGPGP